MSEEINNIRNNINMLTINLVENIANMMEQVDNFAQEANNNLDLLKDVNKEESNKEEGITIDYNTFSKLVNVLSYGVNNGTVEEEFYNEIVNMGIDQTNNEEEIPEELFDKQLQEILFNITIGNISPEDGKKQIEELAQRTHTNMQIISMPFPNIK